MRKNSATSGLQNSASTSKLQERVSGRGSSEDLRNRLPSR